MALLLGIDLGTSYFKVGLFDESGTLRGLGRVAVEPQSPGPERFELPVPVFWERLRRGLDEALNQAGATADAIAGISYSSQANTLVLLANDGLPLTPLIFWHDQRAAPVDDDLAAFGRTEEHGRVTGLIGVTPGRASVKCRWFARHQPEIWARTRWIMTISDYLTHALTDLRLGDASTAVLTGLYSLPGRDWWPAALATFGIDGAQLSRPLTPGRAIGVTGASARTWLGLPAGIPYAVGALDHHAAALGSGLGAWADASLSTGTVLAALVLVDAIKPEAGCIHGPHVDDRRFYRLTFDPRGAGQVEDYRRTHAPGFTIEQLLDQAERASVSLESPLPVHGAAMLELLQRIADTQKRLLAQVADLRPVQRVTATGGGARSPFWLQLTADTLGVPLVAVASPERACLGAALWAAVAAGVWPDLATASARMVKAPRVFSPRP